MPRSVLLFRFTALWLLVFGLGRFTVAAEKPRAAVQVASDGTLDYALDSRGNRVPDFSFCGYANGDRDIPIVPVKVVVHPIDGDDGARIQAAIDYVAAQPLDTHGFRGAIRLSPGEFQVATQLRIQDSGIVLQGSGADAKGTALVATGHGRRALVLIRGQDDRSLDESRAIARRYSPVGATSLTLDSTEGLSVGDTVLITRDSTKEWIDLLDCRELYLGWKPGSRDITWERVVKGVSAKTIHFDAPLTTSIDPKYASGSVQPIEWPGRIRNLGIEDLRMVSSCDANNPADEDHAWFGVLVENAKDTWIRRIAFEHFSGGAVSLGENSIGSTVEDCLSLAPVSELGGYRRHAYFTLGQLALFNRCWSENGRHDFGVGHCSAGPNAFVQCRAKLAHQDSGPIESWSSGVLFDNVRIDGNSLRFENRWNSPPKAGWSAANCVLWQCRAAHVHCFRPPGENNWAIGCWATHHGDGTIESINDFVNPFSLYQAQLRERRGADAAKRLEPFLGRAKAATNPSPAQAAKFVEQSNVPARGLVDFIRENIAASGARLRENTPRAASRIEQVARDGLAEDSASHPDAKTEIRKLSIRNGWVVDAQGVVTGRRLTPKWWRGTLPPEEAAALGPNITRFAPGRFGDGRTNDLRELADRMAADQFASYEHHYGLWYDRRRDDHLMVRRATSGVQPPFYEQPFKRSGQGTAWDGLSKYELTAYNPWYWDRLSRFAKLCEQRGMLLMHHNYFQHNILEAGAHWVDSPWRPANNVNHTGLPEPPPFIGDKRIFMAHNFYDVSNPKLRALHRRYIRHCLEAFASRSNVLQLTSAEYTGPLEFTKFWLETIAEWQEETGEDAIVALSCTKDVQDAILADETYREIIDVIDIRYWMYDKNFAIYAPPGGKNLAPRQHLRQRRSAESSFASIVKAVGEYRLKYPAKAIIYNADHACRSDTNGWAVLMGGGSLADVRLPQELRKSVSTMRPSEQHEQGISRLSATSGEQLVFFDSLPMRMNLRLPTASSNYQIRWIDPSTGRIVAREDFVADSEKLVMPKTAAAWIVPRPKN